MNSTRRIILFVIPDEHLRGVLSEALGEYSSPYEYEIVFSTREARSILSKGIVSALIMTKLAALFGGEGDTGLIEAQTKLPPTLTLIQDGDGFPDYLYAPGAFHDWCTVPFSLDELFSRLTFLLERAQKK